MEFRETSVFTKRVTEHLDDEEYANLQLSLVLDPKRGRVIPNGGGIRKLRWGAGDRGKRGGLRVIYYYISKDNTTYMLYVYDKSQQGDLTRDQVKVLRSIVKED